MPARRKAGRAGPLHTHLNHVDASIQKDAAFGFLGGFLVFIGIEDVGAVRELRKVKIPSLEYLQEEGIVLRGVLAL